MSVWVYLKKSINVVFWLLDKVSKKNFCKLYPKYLNWLGIKIDTNKIENMWISPTTFFDSSHYDLISIGEMVTISFGVSILVHDYSIVHAMRICEPNKKCSNIIYNNVKIGNNVFIGARTIILPGTNIGDNCIIGAGSVVKGELKSNTIYCGNPARPIGSISDFAEKHKSLLD